MSDETRVARRVVVHGKVQGVFFRDGCRREADHLGVTGWASNEPDGSVSAVFEGPPAAVEALVDWARTGSTHSVVERVEVEDTALPGATEFRVK